MMTAYSRNRFIPRHWYESGPAGPEAETGTTGPTGVTGVTAPAGGDVPDNLSDNQRQAWERLTTQRDQSRHELNTLKSEFEKMKSQIDEINRQKQEEADEALRKAGDHEKLATKYKNDWESAKQKVETLETQIESLTDVIKAGVDSLWKQLPPKITAVWPGTDDDVVGKWNWLHSKGVQDLVNDSKDDDDTNHGNRKGPRGSGNTFDAREERQALLARSTLRM